MKKIITAILTIAMLASLAGCSTDNSENDSSGSGFSNSSDNGNSSSTVSDDNSETNESVPEKDKGEPTFLAGPDGEPIYTGEITAIIDDNGDNVTIENITPGGFSKVVCEGFCYLSEPTGISSNERDNPDKWNGAFNCADIPEEPLTAEYKRLNVGDTFCGLKIKKANSEFSCEESGNFMGCNVEFEGELTLTGYITINSDNNYSIGVGDLQFIIDDKSAVLPGSYDRSTGWASTGYSPYFSYNGFYMDNGKKDLDWYWSVNEYGQIYLGNVSTCTADISDIGGRDMCYYKVKVKIDNLMIGQPFAHLDLSNAEYRYFADIVELEAID